MTRRKERRTTRPEFNKKFAIRDISNFPKNHVFYEKWIVLKSFGKLGHSYCYQVCDKKVEIIGRLYIEICDEGMSSVGNMVEFLMKQNAVGNSHRFSSLIDSGLIHDSVIYMVIAERNGPRLQTLLDVCKNNTGKEHGFLSPRTASFFAMDLIQTMEILTSTGYLLRKFDANQWVYDVKHRMIFLADPTDVMPITDKRYASIPDKQIDGLLDLYWKGSPHFAPINALVHGRAHRMSETDMVETAIYVLYEYCLGQLPWKEVIDLQRNLNAKQHFLKMIPQLDDCKNTDPFMKWFDTCLRNMVDCMKIAEEKHTQFAKLPVRGGAWCPNGPRAGALISAMNYGSIIQDFHTIVIEGKPGYTQHWRNVVLSWEKVIDHTVWYCRIAALLRKTRLFVLQSCEQSDYNKEMIYEQKVLTAKKRHYEVMTEHGEAERAVNEVEIGAYLLPETVKVEQETAEEEPIVPVRKYNKRKPSTTEKTTTTKKQKNTDELEPMNYEYIENRPMTRTQKRMFEAAIGTII